MKEMDTYDKGEVDIYEVTDDMPLNLRERKQTAILYETFKEKAQWGEFYRYFGFTLCALGAYWLALPFYSVLCQTFGFSMKTHAQDYRRKDEEINVYRKFRVGFLSHTQDEIPWSFEPSTPTIVVNAGETALSFYKVYNRADRPVAGIAIYQVYPETASIYFNKIQCFCFENQLLYPNESLDLPVLFYLDPAINHDPLLAEEQEIYLTYHFYPCADQTIAETLQLEIEKHQRQEKELLKRKKVLVESGVQGIDLETKSSIIAKGYDPQDKPEVFVKKILANQKRLKHTVDMFVKENKLPSEMQIGPKPTPSKEELI